LDAGRTDREIVAGECDILLRQNRSQQLQRFIEDGGALAIRHHEDLALRGIAERSPNTGSTRFGASPANDASCLATNTGWRPGSTTTDVPTFKLVVLASA
jgi:hypothetical protein